jgi:O-antigen ligase
MAYPLREIVLLPSKGDKWIIAGFYSLCLTLFMMPFPRTFALWTQGAFLFFGLICWIREFHQIVYILKQNKALLLAPVAYFILYLVYYLFGDHLWPNVEDKLMFLLIPLFGLPLFVSDYLWSNLRLILLSFITGLIVICIYQFTRVTLESLSFINGKFVFDPFVSPGVSRFVWDKLSGFEHPSYLAIKALWAIVLLFFTRDTLKMRIWQTSVLIAVFSLFIYFLAAKAELLILIILFIYFLFSRLKSSNSRIIFVLLIPFSLFVLFRIAGQNIRIEQKISQIEEKKAVGKIDWKNFDHRTRSWFCSYELIRKSPLLGVGLDARNILAQEYIRKGYNIEADARLNSHNQYLETQLTLGLAGTVVLLWMLIAPLIRRKHTWNPRLIIPFIVIVSVSMIFESILVRQWGIMFFVLFYCLITLPGTPRLGQPKTYN